MKRIFKTTLVLVLAVLAVSCGTSSSKSELPPLKIEIPTELKDNDEMVDFIEKSEKTINEFSETMEEAAKDLEKYQIKDTEDLSMMEQVKLAAFAGKFAVNYSEFMVQFTELMEKADNYEGNLGEDEAKALETVMTAFTKRMEELQSKYDTLSIK